ncbi:D-Ala-D-Ala carboxypeptidase family metallohydrolase [Terasakiella sp. A23]|uniref:D-Ala-D-Ala carboxypeptidase family metallohydrolase n=1 Tax=Terasakiella sp. FCG-A23 TaxID=3080561 RepID=UPI00295306C2|nr:D-Ala-D-Ala carboxypeptidase family metallohydrolase [Terasakiella sp. A23]MDV7340988.1 D-Ala-D-Ala carboxypeptidase family metallohydrolase [Terasakiella sp. A23]
MSDVDLNTQLSDNFTLREAIQSQTALRLGISNLPTAEQTVQIVRVAQNILQPVRNHFGIPFSPSSWFRCPQLNHQIGSSSKSQHAKGEAVDFEVPGIPNLEVAQWIVDNLNFDQLILEFYDGVDPNSGWIHCSFVDKSVNRRAALRFDGKNFMTGLGD